MKLKTTVLVLLTALSTLAATQAAPLNIIIDTDTGNDIDDVLALSLAHGLQAEGLCKILAVTTSKDHPLSAPFIRMINRFYGHPEIPIGEVHRGASASEGKYLKLALIEPTAQYPDAIQLMRRTLAAAPDNSVAIIQIGFFTNLARLLDSKPDDLSPLTGRELIQKKVKSTTIMAGDFSGRESLEEDINIKSDLSSAQRVFTQWPAKITFSGWEVGRGIRYPLESIRYDFNYADSHPAKEAYRLTWTLDVNRPCWDLTAVLAAVCPEQGFFGYSAPGTALLQPNGRTTFEPRKDGLHTHLTITSAQVHKNVEYLAEVCPRPPRTDNQASRPDYRPNGSTLSAPTKLSPLDL